MLPEVWLMPRELLVLRHGKSDWTPGVPDFERPLAPRGRRASKRIGRLLRERGLLPDLVVTSPARRAQDTAARVCLQAGIDPSCIEKDAAIYEADLDTLLDVLAPVPPHRARVMIVGHNPGFDELVRHLAGTTLAEWDDANLMPSAALAHLEMPDSWSDLGPGTGRCLGIVRPRDLE